MTERFSKIAEQLTSNDVGGRKFLVPNKDGGFTFVKIDKLVTRKELVKAAGDGRPAKFVSTPVTRVQTIPALYEAGMTIEDFCASALRVH